MWKYLFFLLSSLLSLVADQSDFIDRYLDKKVDVEMPYQMTHSSEYYIFAAQEDTPAQLLRLLDDTDYKNDWPTIIMVLGSLSVGYDVPVEPLMKAAEDWERSTEIGDGEKLKYIERAYWALAREGSEASLSFLKKRTRKEFWEERDMPTYVVKVDHSDTPAETVTARSEVIIAISKHRLEAAELYLQELYKDPEFYGDPILRRRLESAARMRGTWMRGHEKRVRAFEVKRELAGESPDSVVEATAEIPQTPLAPEAVEEVEEVAQPKPATEKPAEVVTFEQTEEPAEQSSNWWLWLIGALVVVGGVFVLRSKK